jgi:hypothetical protein
MATVYAGQKILASHNDDLETRVTVLETAAPWSSISSFDNGWSGTFKYRVVPGVANHAQIFATLTPGTLADGTQVCTLPAGYYAVSSLDVPCLVDQTVSAGQSPHLQVDNDGKVYIWGAGGSCTYVHSHNIYPLDA